VKLNDATRIFPIKPSGGPVIVHYAFIDVIDGFRVSATSGRPRSSVQSDPNPPAGRGGILRRNDGRKDSRLEGAAAFPEERRLVCRRPYRLPLALSVFNQGAVFEGQMVDCGQDGICVETGRRVLPGTSIYLRFDTRSAVDEEKAVSLGLRTTALGEVKWCRALGPTHSPPYRIGIRYYPHY
jgi:hypothetical protein